MAQNDNLGTITLTAAGGAIPLDANDFLKRYIVVGSATLLASYTFSSSGTLTIGDVFEIDYDAQMTLNGNNITIFGRVLTQEEALKKFRFLAIYDGTVFHTFVVPTTDMLPRAYSGVNTTTLTAGGGTINLDPAKDKQTQLYIGNATLLGSWVIQGGGTPQDGDSFTIVYSATLTPNGNNVTIFGQTLTPDQIKAGNTVISVVYDSTSASWIATQSAASTATPTVSQSYAQMVTLAAGADFEVNRLYFINDRNIYVRAITTTQLSLTGEFLMRSPDYQNVSGNFIGTWIATMAAPGIGDLVAYDNFMWSSVTGAVGTAPSGDAVNWLCLGTFGSGTWKDWVNKVGAEYVDEIYACEYDFENDWVQVLHDKRRGNKIGGSYQYEQLAANGFNVIDKFKWGCDVVFSNTANEALLSNVNSLGEYASNFLNPESKIIANTLTATSKISTNTLEQNSTISTNTLAAGATIEGNLLSAGSVLKDKTLNANVNIYRNLIDFNWDAVETIASDISEKTLISGLSNMAATLDLDTAIYAGTTLTIPTFLNYVGVFTLTSAADKTITKIANLPSNHQCYFKGVNGRTYTFTSTAIAGAVANDIVRTAGAGNDLVVGRTNGNDLITVDKAGTMNRVYNAIILT